jgi:hypothetical protein
MARSFLSIGAVYTKRVPNRSFAVTPGSPSAGTVQHKQGHGVPWRSVPALGAGDFSGEDPPCWVAFSFPLLELRQVAASCGGSFWAGEEGGAAEEARTMQSNEMDEDVEGPTEVNTTKASHLVKACQPPPPPPDLNPTMFHCCCFPPPVASHQPPSHPIFFGCAVNTH